MLSLAVSVSSVVDPVVDVLDLLWAPVVAAVLLIVLLRSTRWLVLIWRGRTPRVQISPFAWTASEGGASEATWVTSLFREQLGALRLDALDPLPERAPGAPLVEIVEGVGQGVAQGLDIGKAAGRLFRAVWPDAAYEVWGTLRPRDDGAGVRIAVQLVDRRHGNRTLLNVALESTEWKEAARQAAMAVAGALYPRVRERDRGPWTMWKETVPRELMAAYHTARDYEEANWLEQALDRYHAALDQDPLNPNLRLKIAMLQERLELDLDAWVTYEAIVDESDPRAWHGPNRRVYLVAHYRLAILLGNGRVAEQWVKNDSLSERRRTKRDRERQELREELVPSLESDLLDAERNFQTPEFRLVSASAARLLARLREADGEAEDAQTTLKLFKPPFIETETKRQRRREEIDAVLQVLSLRHLEELDAWLRARPPARWGQWWDWWVHRPAAKRILVRRELSRSAVRISKLVIRIRVAASLELRYLSSPTLASETEKVRETHRQLTRRWPFPPVDAWHRLTHWVAPRRRWNNGRDDAWQLHYNAACAAASALRHGSVLTRAEEDPGPGKALPDGTTRDDVMARAIAELEDYAYRAGSQRVAAQADWLAIDDPDFEGLREMPRFTLWARHHLPRGLPPKEPYRKSDVKRFTVRVLRDGARAVACSWRERADNLDASAEEISLWWRSERNAWETLRTSCREHLSWNARLNGLKALQGWMAETERTEEIDFGYESRGDMAAAATPGDDVFEALVELAGDRRPLISRKRTVLPWVQDRVEKVRTAYEDGETRADASGVLLAADEREEALRAFRIWTWLADALTAELHGSSSNGSAAGLRHRLERIHRDLPPPPGGTQPPTGEGSTSLASLAQGLMDSAGR